MAGLTVEILEAVLAAGVPVTDPGVQRGVEVVEGATIRVRTGEAARVEGLSASGAALELGVWN